jgi:hypothetical protein
MGEKPSTTGEGAFEQLRDVLDVARMLARQMSEDGLLGRLIAVFEAMPKEDRATIIAILEREILGRHVSRGTEKAVGQSTHLNPNARLYVRAHSSTVDHRYFDRDEMMIADVRAMRVARIIRNIPDLRALWREALAEAMDQVDEATRADAEELLRDGLAAIAEARVAEEAASRDAAASPVSPESPAQVPEAESGTSPDAPLRPRRS